MFTLKLSQAANDKSIKKNTLYVTIQIKNWIKDQFFVLLLLKVCKKKSIKKRLSVKTSSVIDGKALKSKLLEIKLNFFLSKYEGTDKSIRQI